MAIVVLDTDAASRLFERRLPAPMLQLLMGQTLMITFVTIAEAGALAAQLRWSSTTSGPSPCFPRAAST